jgi:hypothetical protein
MDEIGTWRPGTRLTSAGRAGVVAAVVLVVTTAAAALLAVVSKQAWLPVLVSVLIAVPGMYLTWNAVPPGARRTRGRQAAGWGATDLGVHQANGSGRMPTYVRRPHDDLLDAVLDPRVAASRLVVVRGDSSTGKSRAAYEAAARGKLAAGVPSRGS